MGLVQKRPRRNYSPPAPAAGGADQPAEKANV
jgi:hypothetical protein